MPCNRLETNFLQALYEINSKSGNEHALKLFLTSAVEAHNLSHKDNQIVIDEDEFGNLYFVKGDAYKYPCFVAHMDEVHEPCDRNIIFEDDIVYGIDRKTGKRCGIGADDKNGIYICIQLLFEPYISNMKVALFREEEVGLVGSAHARLEFFEDCLYVVQPDGPCNHEFSITGFRKKVTWELSRERDWSPYKEILRDHQFHFADGGATDVVMLKMRTLDVPCAEISAGYYSYHKSREFTVLSELQNCYDACFELATIEL